MIEIEQFEACMSDIRKKIHSIHSKFDAQEYAWQVSERCDNLARSSTINTVGIYFYSTNYAQVSFLQKAIDDFVNEINEKADFTQLTDLRDNLKTHIESLQDRIKSLCAIVGEPKASAVSKHIIRDTNCLSCRQPALLNPEGSGIPDLPALNRPPTIGADAMTEGGDGLCYPGQTIPHILDPRFVFITNEIFLICFMMQETSQSSFASTKLCVSGIFLLGMLITQMVIRNFFICSSKLCRRYCGGYVTGQRQTLQNVSTKRIERDQPKLVGTDGKVNSTCRIIRQHSHR